MNTNKPWGWSMIDDVRNAETSLVFCIVGWSREVESRIAVPIGKVAFHVLGTGAFLTDSMNFGGPSKSIEASLFPALRVDLRLLLGQAIAVDVMSADASFFGVSFLAASSTSDCESWSALVGLNVDALR